MEKSVYLKLLTKHLEANGVIPAVANEGPVQLEGAHYLHSQHLLSHLINAKKLILILNRSAIMYLIGEAKWIEGQPADEVTLDEPLIHGPPIVHSMLGIRESGDF